MSLRVPSQSGAGFQWRFGSTRRSGPPPETSDGGRGRRDDGATDGATCPVTVDVESRKAGRRDLLLTLSTRVEARGATGTQRRNGRSWTHRDGRPAEGHSESRFAVVGRTGDREGHPVCGAGVERSVGGSSPRDERCPHCSEFGLPEPGVSFKTVTTVT